MATSPTPNFSDLKPDLPVPAASSAAPTSPDFSGLTPDGAAPGAPANLSNLTPDGQGQVLPKDDEGFVSKAWDWAEKAFINPETITNAAGKFMNLSTLGVVGRAKKSDESWSQAIDRSVNTPVMDPLEEKFPFLAGIRVGTSRAVQDYSRVGSMLSSPAVVATMLANVASEGTGALAKIAATLTGAADIKFGQESGSVLLDGLKKIHDAGNISSEDGADGLQKVLYGLSGLSGSAAGLGKTAAPVGAAAARYTNAVRESAANVTGGWAEKSAGKLSEKVLAKADAEAAKIDVHKVLGNAKDLGVLDDATHDHISKIAASAPDKAARVLYDKINGDSLGENSPKPDVTTSATDDGKAVVSAMATTLPQELRNQPVIKELLSKGTVDTMGEMLAKKLDGSTLETLTNNGHPEVSQLLSNVAENHIFRTALSSLDSTAYLNKLKMGYDKLNPGVRDLNPEIQQHADTVNDLLRLKKQVDTLQQKFPNTDIASWSIKNISNHALKAAAMNLFGGLLGYESLGWTGSLGVPVAMWGIKSLAQTAPVLRAISSSMGSISEALRPKIDVPATVRVENGIAEAPVSKLPEPVQAPPAEPTAATPQEAPAATEPIIHQTPQGREPGDIIASTGGENPQPAATSRKILDIANDYQKQRGAPELTAMSTPKVSENAPQIADAYEAAQHNPEDPEVAKSYKALVKEVKDQWDYATQSGIKFEPWGKEGQPYANSHEMMDDVNKNHHLYFFQGGDIPEDHPLAQVDQQTGLTYNDMFRAVHDLFGHAMHGFQFGPRGEEGAFLAHSQMFSPEAQPAMMSETKAQNSWVNFGKHLRDETGAVAQKGQPGYVAPTDRPYAEQKATVLPEELRQPVQTRPISAEKSPLANAEPVDTAKPQLVEKPTDALTERIKASQGKTPQEASRMMNPYSERPATTEAPTAQSATEPTAEATPAPAPKVTTSPTVISKPEPEPTRAFNIGRGMNGPVRVVFPDKLHADLYAYWGRWRAEMRGEPRGYDLALQQERLSKGLGVAKSEIGQMSQNYRDQINGAIKPLEEGSRFDAPKSVTVQPMPAPAPKAESIYEKFHGTYPNRELAEEASGKRPGSEVFEHQTGPNKGKFGVATRKAPAAPRTQMTLDDAVAQHIKEHPEDADKPAFDNLDSFMKNHPEINSLDFDNSGPIYRAAILTHELSHAYVANHLGIPVNEIHSNERGAALGIDLSKIRGSWESPDINERGDVALRILTALSGQPASYLSALTAGGVGERALGRIPEMSLNWDGEVEGSDRYQFNRVLKQLEIPRTEWDGIWDHHIQKAQDILNQAPDLHERAAALAQRKNGVGMSKDELHEFLGKSAEATTPRAGGTPEERLNFINKDDVKEVDPKRAARKVSSLIDQSIANAAKEGHDNVGVTYNPSRGKDMAASGEYAVSAYPEKTVMMKTRPTEGQIQKFVEANQQLYKDPSNNVGIWKSTSDGKWYMDVTNTHPDKDFATYVGQNTNQVGITHLDGKNFDFVPTDGDGKYTGKENYAPAASRINELYKNYVESKQPQAVGATR